jgi:hypothetical protein
LLNQQLPLRTRADHPEENLGIPGSIRRIATRHELPFERRRDYREVVKGFTTSSDISTRIGILLRKEEVRYTQ